MRDAHRTTDEQLFSAVKEFEEWNDVAGVLPKGTSYYYECLSIVEDADKEIERMRKQLGRLALLILQNDRTEAVEWAAGVKITFPNGEPQVST